MINEYIKGKKIVIFGAGQGDVFNYLIKNYKDNIVGIIDNDINKLDKEISGIKISNPNALKNFSKDDVLVVVSTYNYWKEIEEQLNELGWKNSYLIAKRDVEFFSSYEFELWRNGIIENKYSPIECEIELSGKCNLKCVYCPVHGILDMKKDKSELMDWETLKATVEQIKKISTIKKVYICGSGEFFMNPQWFEMAEYVLKETKIPCLGAYTNGMLLNEKNIRKLLALNAKIELEISIDGESPEENDKYRIGAKYSIIKNNVDTLERLIDEMAPDIEVIIGNTRPINKKELEELKYCVPQYSKKTIDYLKTDFPNITICNRYACCHDASVWEGYKDLLPVKVKSPAMSIKRCTNLFTRIFINCNGELMACGNAGSWGKVIGNVFDDDIFELWKNHPELEMTREQFLKDGKAKGICEKCYWNGEPDYYLLMDNR